MLFTHSLSSPALYWAIFPTLTNDTQQSRPFQIHNVLEFEKLFNFGYDELLIVFWAIAWQYNSRYLLLRSFQFHSWNYIHVNDLSCFEIVFRFFIGNRFDLKCIWYYVLCLMPNIITSSVIRTNLIQPGRFGWLTIDYFYRRFEVCP